MVCFIAGKTAVTHFWCFFFNCAFCRQLWLLFRTCINFHNCWRLLLRHNTNFSLEWVDISSVERSSLLRGVKGRGILSAIFNTGKDHTPCDGAWLSNRCPFLDCRQNKEPSSPRFTLFKKTRPYTIHGTLVFVPFNVYTRRKKMLRASLLC